MVRCGNLRGLPLIVDFPGMQVGSPEWERSTAPTGYPPSLGGTLILVNFGKISQLGESPKAHALSSPIIILFTSYPVNVIHKET